ncbi:MAG: peptidylprolyl isomerase [Blastocatellia bacterium]
MRARSTITITLLIVAGMLAAQSCKYLFKSDYAALNPADMTTLADTFPEMQKRMLAQNEQARKGFIDNFKRAFALAQAAEAEGLDKSEKFKQQLAINVAQLLAVEFGKRNPDTIVKKEDWEAYYAAHKTEFEADFSFVNKSRKQTPTDEQKEQQREMWSEMKHRAELASKAGIEKDPAIVAQIKFGKANILANLYAELLEERFKLTDAERKTYIAEHPEADVEKLREKAQGLLDRVKKGESFEKIADEFNEDGTKGRGGDLDWFARGKMDPDFETAAFALQKGQLTTELVKTGFGYHIIRVDDRRMSAPPPPPPAGASPGPVAAPTPQEEIRARHIFVGTQEADSYEGRLVQEKIKRAMEDATLKYPVAAPTDFKVNVGGVDPNRVPGLGGGQGGSMKRIDPGENK